MDGVTNVQCATTFKCVKYLSDLSHGRDDLILYLEICLARAEQSQTGLPPDQAGLDSLEILHSGTTSSQHEIVSQNGFHALFDMLDIPN